jgi:phage terminase large subunit-like protein
VVITTDDAGNIKPSKTRSREKIDGIVALVEGVAAATDPFEPAEVLSDYGGGGLRTL